MNLFLPKVLWVMAFHHSDRKEARKAPLCPEGDGGCSCVLPSPCMVLTKVPILLYDPPIRHEDACGSVWKPCFTRYTHSAHQQSWCCLSSARINIKLIITLSYVFMQLTTTIRQGKMFSLQKFIARLFKSVQKIYSNGVHKFWGEVKTW